MNIYVSNLSNQITADDLRAAFGKYGRVEASVVFRDNPTDREKGLGVVMMPAAHARVAIAVLNGSNWKGQAVTISDSPPQSTHQQQLSQKLVESEAFLESIEEWFEEED